MVGLAAGIRLCLLPEVLKEQLRPAVLLRYDGRGQAARSGAADPILADWGAESPSFIMTVGALLATLVCRRQWHVLPWSPAWKAPSIADFGLPLPANLNAVPPLLISINPVDHITPQVNTSCFHDAGDFILELLGKASSRLLEEEVPPLEASASVHVKALREAVELLSPSAREGLAATSASYTAVHLVNTLFLTSVARNVEHLDKILGLAVRLTFPALTQEYDRRRFKALPHKGSVSRHRFTLDYAMMVCHMRKFSPSLLAMSSWDPTLEIPDDTYFVSTLADASPYRGRELYLQESVYIHSGMMLEAEAAAHELSTLDVDETLRQFDEEDSDFALLLRVRELHETISRTVHRHCHCPTFLGTRELGLVKKLQATLHTVGLEAPGLRGVLGWLNSVSSLTVDMGTEVGLGLLPAVPLHMVTQSWRWASKLVMLGDVGGQEGEHLPSADAGVAGLQACRLQDNLFAWAVVIPGCMHLMNTTSAFVMSRLTALEGIKVRFQAICSILHSSNVLQRLRRTCFSGHEVLFDFVFAAAVPLAIHWRWGSIQACLTRLLEVRHSLRRFWSIEVYLQGSDRDEEMEEHSCEDDRQKARAEMREHLKLADEAIKDDYFWGACAMLAALQNVLASIEAFCSGCPCHGADLQQKEKTRARRLSRYQKLAGTTDKGAFCPLVGCRCPEVATDHLHRVIEETAAMQEHSIFEESMADDGVQVREHFVREWHIGIALLMVGITEKLSFWSQLPHLLCGLAAWDRGQVVKCAARCLQLYSEVEETVHHPLSRLLLSPTALGSCRVHIVALSNGVPVSELPRSIQKLIVRMRFWSLLETPIEEKHARLSRVVSRNTNWSGALVSLALRLPQFMRATEKDPELYREVV